MPNLPNAAKNLPVSTSPSSPNKAQLTPLAQLKQQQWRAVKEHLQDWYAQPDLEALRASMAVYLSHFMNDTPIWMFLLGPPSTGKSELCITPLSKQLETHTISTITEASFISAFNEKAGILPNLRNGNGVLLFSDFSNFLALNPEVRGKLQAQMREIYDGKYQKHSGNRRNPVVWEGKVTILAACTPELERYWGLENSLGDRFLQIQLIPPDPTVVNQFMLKQFGMDKSKIIATTNKLITNFLTDIDEHPDVTPPSAELVKKLFLLTDVCVSLRQSIHRNYQGKLVDIGTKEGTPRFARMALNLAKTHAKMFGRSNLIASDERILTRVLQDTCPRRRIQFCRILLNWDDAISMNDFRTHIPDATYQICYKTIEELQALGVIRAETIMRDKEFWLDPEFRELLLTAGISPWPIG